MEQAMLTTTQAANYLRLSRRTLEGYRVRGGGPLFVKLGGAVRYRFSDLEAWVESCVRLSTADADPGQVAA